MQVIRSPRAMQQLAQRLKRRGRRIAFVPTMGCLHEGHARLMRRARRAVGPRGVVVVSIFVNPTQFGPKEDFQRYPRDLAGDARLCRAAGVDFIFHPGAAAMYPGRSRGVFSTYVMEERLSRSMEGASRPGHFRGVATVVVKLFNLVLPEVAVFGAKDWQQAALIRRVVADLNFPVKILVAPTVRERDGLAMSSRNRYLNPAERARATVLHRALQRARAAVRKGSVAAARLKADLLKFIAREPLARPDYVEFFDGRTLEPVARARRGTHLALAVFIGRTRLIDNGRL
jgi:pantoate--beta-alanine ligase